MYLGWVVSTVFLEVSLWFVVTTPNPQSNNIITKPEGPRMCRRLCNHKENQKLLEDKKNLICVSNSKTFRTGINIMKCQRNQLKKTQSVKYTRLLMLQSGLYNQEARQFNLNNKSVTRYPHIRAKKATAVAYITTSRKLIVFDAAHRELFLVPLDDKDKIIIQRGTVFSGIAVDNQKQQVFLASSKPNKIQVMTTDGKQIRFLVKTGSRLGNIAVDPKKQVIYVVVFAKYVDNYSYKGVLQNTIARGYIREAVCLNSERNALYYLKGKYEFRLFKVNLTKGIVHSVPIPFKPYAHHIYVLSNKLYLTPKNNRAILSVLNESGKQTGIIKTGFGPRVFSVRACAIP